METDKRILLANRPLDTTATTTIQVVLWDRERSKICLVLDKGGVKERNGGSYEKPRGLGNIAGKVRVGETPYEAAVRETEEESNHMRNTFRIKQIPVDVKTSYGNRAAHDKPHHKIVFVGEVIDPGEPLESMDVRDPSSGILKRIWVPFSELPGMLEAEDPTFVFRGEHIYTSHLSYIYTTRSETL